MRNIVTLAALTFLVGCGGSKRTYESVEATAASDAPLVEEADALWAERGDAAKLAAALAKYEEAYNAGSTDRHVASQLVRGWYFLGDAHKSEMDDKLAAWSHSMEWGERCLGLNAEFKALVDKGEKEEMAARAIVAEDVPCVYWMASAMGKWSKASGLGKTLKNLPIVKAFQGRVTELEPDYFYAGPDRYWGAYYAAIPSFAGQDLDKSRAHFDAAIAAYPDHLGNRVLIADYWAGKAQDRAVYEEQLNYVVNADPNTIEGLEPEQAVEQAKAKALLAEIDNKFLN